MFPHRSAPAVSFRSRDEDVHEDEDVHDDEYEYEAKQAARRTWSYTPTEITSKLSR